MRNETKGCAAQASPGHGIKPIGGVVDLLTLLVGLLPQDAIEMRRTGRLQVNGHDGLHLIEPVKNLLVLLRIDLLIGHITSTSGRDQQEDMVRGSSESHGEIEHRLSLLNIV